MHVNETIRKTTRTLGRSVTFKLVTICGLILILLVPVAMVKSLIRERRTRQQGVIDDISFKWGRAQTIVGPLISVPYFRYVQGKNGRPIKTTGYLHFLPEKVHIDSRIVPQVRYRSIYQVVLYNTALTIGGSFSRPPDEALPVAAENIQWKGAFISLGITDMRGIKDRIAASFGGQDLALEPGIATADVIRSGVSSGIDFEERRSGVAFHLALKLNGSRHIRFCPVGKATTVDVSSPWKDPSFDGAFLPDERHITPSGFTAKWKVLHLNRNYPQIWKGKRSDLDKSSFGVSLYSPVEIYQQSMRTAKYALMLIVFTFVAFFIAEILSRLRIHPVQYLLVGMAIIIFYALLLSLSEQVRFGMAYLASSLAVIGLITGYASAILKRRKTALMVAGILTVLYAYMYILLQLEDYALLMGSIGLFFVLAAAMFLTRHIDWYGDQEKALNTGRIDI